MKAERIEALAQHVEADEAFADHFASLSRIAYDRGDRSSAVAFARHSRLHRVKAIEIRAIVGAYTKLADIADRTLR